MFNQKTEYNRKKAGKKAAAGLMVFLLSGMAFGAGIFLPSALASSEPLMDRRAKPVQASTPVPADPGGGNDSKPVNRLPLDSTVPDNPFSPPDMTPAALDLSKTLEVQLRPVAIMNKVDREGSQGYLYKIEETGVIDIHPNIIENPMAVMGAPDEDARIGSIQDPGFAANQDLKLYLVKSSTTVAELNSVDIPGNHFAEVFVSGNSVKFYALADDFEPSAPGASQTFSLFTPLTISSAPDGLPPPSD